MTPRNGGSSRFWRILVAIVLLAVVAIGLLALFPPARQPVGQPSSVDEDDDPESYAPVSSPSPVTEEDDGSQAEFAQPLIDTGESRPNGAPATDTPSADDDQ